MWHELVHTTRHVTLTAFSNMHLQNFLCRYVTEISNASAKGWKYDILKKILSSSVISKL